MQPTPIDNRAFPGLSLSLMSICLLMACTVSPPEDFKVALYGTASILPPAVISFAKLASRLFAIGVCILSAVQLRTDERFRPVVSTACPLLLFCFWSVSSTLWSPLRPMSLMQSASFCLLIGLALIIGISCRCEADVSRALKVLSLAALAMAMTMLVLRLLGPKYGALTRSSSGVLHSTNAGAMSSIGALVLISALLLWEWKWVRVILLPGLAVHAAVIGICGNRLSAALVLLLSVVVVCLFSPRVRVAGMAVLCGLAGAIYLVVDSRLVLFRSASSDIATMVSQGQTSSKLKSFSGRSEMWEMIWKSYSESPLLGHGYFVTSSTGRIFVWDEWGNWTAHNWLLQLLVTTGGVGAFLLIFGLAWVGLRAVLRWQHDQRTAGFVAVVALWFVGWGVLNSSFIGPLMPESLFFAVALGLALSVAAPRTRTVSPGISS